MSDRPELEQLERVVSQILERHVALMKDELVRSVSLPGDATISAAGASGESTSGQLLKAISAIQAGSTQREILRALLDNMVLQWPCSAFRSQRQQWHRMAGPRLRQ